MPNPARVGASGEAEGVWEALESGEGGRAAAVLRGSPGAGCELSAAGVLWGPCCRLTSHGAGDRRAALQSQPKGRLACGPRLLKAVPLASLVHLGAGRTSSPEGLELSGKTHAALCRCQAGGEAACAVTLHGAPVVPGAAGAREKVAVSPETMPASWCVQTGQAVGNADAKKEGLHLRQIGLGLPKPSVLPLLRAAPLSRAPLAD